MDNQYVKLGELDGSDFTVLEAYGFNFKKWDEASKKMLMEDRWQESMRGDRAWRKMFGVKTSKGKMDLSEKQLKDMLGGVYKGGKSDIIGKTFTVKKYVGENNIPTYYINPAPVGQRAENQSPETSKVDNVAEVVDGETINLDELGW